MEKVTLFQEQIGPMLEQAGYVCILMELKGQGRKILEVSIERLDAVSVGIRDCVAVTRLVQAALEEKDPFGVDFSIEVSSPGPNRPLVSAIDFERFKGQRIKIVLKEAIFGHKVYEGMLQGLNDGAVALEKEPGSPDPQEGGQWPSTIPQNFIKSACLAPLSEKKRSESQHSKGNASKSPSRLTKVKER